MLHLLLQVLILIILVSIAIEATPTPGPTPSPTAKPSPQPTVKPTSLPTYSPPPTPSPTLAPTYLPGAPTPAPTPLPSSLPTIKPSPRPTRYQKKAKLVDPFCTLTGLPARDPAETERLYLRKQSQRCNLLANEGPSNRTQTVGFLNYVRCGVSTYYCTWRVDRGVITISKLNLNRGIAPNAISYQYVRKIDDSVPKHGVTGLILGTMLGGNGMHPQNLFPQSEKIQAQYRAFEKKIYDCLSTPGTLVDKAALRWEFLYRKPTSSRPYLIKYNVDFDDASGHPTQCPKMEMRFDN